MCVDAHLNKLQPTRRSVSGLGNRIYSGVCRLVSKWYQLVLYYFMFPAGVRLLILFLLLGPMDRKQSLLIRLIKRWLTLRHKPTCVCLLLNYRMQLLLLPKTYWNHGLRLMWSHESTILCTEVKYNYVPCCNRRVLIFEKCMIKVQSMF